MENTLFYIIVSQLFYFNLFSQGNSNVLVPFRVKDKWGYSNTIGNVLIKPKYDSVGLFRQGEAHVYVYRDNVLFAGLIDLKGNEIVKPGFGYITSEYDEEHFHIVHNYFFKNVPDSGSLIGLYKNGYGLITKVAYRDIKRINKNNFALEGLKNKNYAVNVVTKKIKRFYKKNFFGCGCQQYSEEMKLEREIEIEEEKILEQEKMEIFKKEYPDFDNLDKFNIFKIDSFYGGTIMYETEFDNEKKVWKTNLDTIAHIYDSITKITDGFYYLAIKNKVGFFNVLNRHIVLPVYDSIYFNQEKKLLFVYLNGGKGVLNIKGEVIVSTQHNFDEFKYFNTAIGELFAVKQANKWSIKNNSGPMFSNLNCDTIVLKSNMYYKFIGIGNNGLYGIIDLKGVLVQPIKYEKLSIFGDEFYFSVNNKIGYKSILTDKLIIKPEWDSIAFNFINYNGYLIKKDNMYGWLDVGQKKNDVYFPLFKSPNFEKHYCESKDELNCFTVFLIKENNRDCYYGENGVKFFLD